MLKTFNCGIGLILIISKNNKEKVLSHLKKNKCNFWIMGQITEKKNYNPIIINNFGKWVLE